MIFEIMKKLMDFQRKKDTHSIKCRDLENLVLGTYLLKFTAHEFLNEFNECGESTQCKTYVYNR